MPESAEEKTSDLADRIRIALGDRLARYAGDLETLRDVLDGKVDVTSVPDDDLRAVVAAALAPPPTPEEQEDRLRDWDPVDLLVPEWRHLQQDPPRRPRRGAGQRPDAVHAAARARAAGRDHPGARGRAAAEGQRADRLHPHRRPRTAVGDLPGRLAPLTRAPRPAWTVATEDRGEGIFLQLDEERVAAVGRTGPGHRAVAGAPRRAPAQLQQTVLRNGRGR